MRLHAPWRPPRRHGVYTLYACRMPYMYACLVCMPYMRSDAGVYTLYACRMPYMYACLICMPYMRSDAGVYTLPFPLTFHSTP